MATAAATHSRQEPLQRPTLFLAFELGGTPWQLGCTTGAAPRPRARRMPAGDGKPLLEEIARAKQRVAFPGDAPGRSGYEADRDGVWLHRF